MHKTPRSTQNAQKAPYPTIPVTAADGPGAHVGKQHTTPALRKEQEGACCFIQRNVTLIRSCSRPGLVQLVLTLATHDRQVTMTTTAQVSFTVRTGLALPSEDGLGAEAYRCYKLLHSRFPKWWLIIAVPSHTRLPSPVKVQVRGGRHLPFSTPWLHQGAIALHTPASSGQHRSPHPVYCSTENRKDFLSREDTQKPPQPRPFCFLHLGPPYPRSNFTARLRLLRSEKEVRRVNTETAHLG